MTTHTFPDNSADPKRWQLSCESEPKPNSAKCQASSPTTTRSRPPRDAPRSDTRAFVDAVHRVVWCRWGG